MNTRELGALGENIASGFLQTNGIQIVMRNYFTNFGEIDIIGIEKKTIIFIEVKLRKSVKYGKPIESINLKKMERIRKSADVFLSNNVSFNDYDCRFDVICLSYSKVSDTFKVEWFRDQFFS